MIRLKIKEIKDGYDVRATYKNFDLGEICALVSDLINRLEVDFGIDREDVPKLITDFEKSYK